MNHGRRTALAAALAVLALAAPSGVASAERVVADQAAYVAPRLDADGELELGILRTAYDGSGEQWSPAAETVVHTAAGSATTVPAWADAFGVTAFGPAGAPLWLTGEGTTTDDAAARGTVLLGWTRELLVGHLATAGSAGTVRVLHTPDAARAASLGIFRDAPGLDPWQVTLTFDTGGEMAPASWQVWRQGSGSASRRRFAQAWAFDAPGYYCIDFESRATLLNGRVVYDRQPISLAVGAVDPQLAPDCPTADGETETTLTASPTGPVEAGEDVVLAAAVGPASAAGTVQFFDDAGDGEQPLGVPVAVADGVAELTTSALAPGRHTIRAAFDPTDPDAHSPSSAVLSPLRVFAPGAYVLETAANELLHADVAVRGDADELGLWLKVDGPAARWQPLEQSILVVPDRARETVPDDPAYAFLAPAGSDLWTVPLSQATGIPWLGISSESIEEDAFQRYAAWRLDGVSDADGGAAPGAFVLWDRADGAKPFFSTRAGLPDAVRMLRRAGGHWHANWSFTAPGVYCLAMAVENRFAADGSAAADRAVMTVVVGDAIDPYTTQTCASRGTDPSGTHPRLPTEAPSGTPHVAHSDGASSERAWYDLLPRVAGGALRVDLLEGDAGGPGTLRDLDDVVFHVGAARELGYEVDADRYLLGWDATLLGPADVAGELQWRLVAHEGPGAFTLGDEWHDVHGDALLSSVPGAAPASQDLWTGRRDRGAWRFSEPGVHCVTLEWAGTTAGGGELRARRTLTFAVDVDAHGVVPCNRRPPTPDPGPGPQPDVRPDPGPADDGRPQPAPRPRKVAVALRPIAGPVRLAALQRRGTLPLRCRLAARGTCEVRATVSVAAARRLGMHVRGRRDAVTIGRGRVIVKRAGSARMVVRLTPQGRRALARADRRVRIRLVVTGRTPGLRTATVVATVVARR
jgi:surface-anchored protein